MSESAFPAGMLAAVVTAYERPPRAYHHFGHIEEVLTIYRSLRWERPIEVHLAILYHDAVYEAGRSDNEERSAQLARVEISRWLPDRGIDLPWVEKLIVLTAQHGRIERASITNEEAQFLDCDMAILGAPAARYER